MIKAMLNINPVWKGTFFAGLVYGFMILSAFVLERFSPSGPCTPGLGVLSLFLFMIANIIWTIADVAKSLRSQELKRELLLHILVLMTWMILFVNN
jgi:hypothetical protein